MNARLTTTAALIERMRMGSKWMDLLVPSLEISDIRLTIVAIDMGGPFSNQRDCRIRVYLGCCKREGSYSKAGLLSRVRRGGDMCKSCRCQQVGQLASEAAQRLRDASNEDSKRARLLEEMADVHWAFGLMNAAMPSGVRVKC